MKLKVKLVFWELVEPSVKRKLRPKPQALIRTMTIGIKRQLSILTLSILVIAVTTTAVLTILIIIQQGEATSREYREEELNRVRTSVKDHVEMAHQSIASNYALIEDKAYLEKFYGSRLRSIMDIAVASIRRNMQAVKEGKLSLKQAQQEARKDIEAMRFDNETGYIWINDTNLPYPKMIMHPTVPSLNDTYLTDPKFNCAMGKNQNLFQAAVEVATANGSGFVDYVWPKPTPGGLTEEVKKLSFVYYAEDWGWVLGTGIYLDDARADIISSILENLKTLKYNDGQGYFWINDMQYPYPTMIMHPVMSSLNGKVLDDTTFNTVKGTGKNMFQAMVKEAQKGSGYVEYMWPNPVTEKREAKLSYVKRFEPLDWVVGTGAFINHIEEKIQAKEKEIEDRVRNIIFITIGISILLIGGGYWATAVMANSLTRSIILVKDSLQDLSSGKKIEKLNVKHKNEIGVMTASLNSLVDGFNSYSTFAKEIGNGNLDSDFKALGSEDELGNSLIQMRDNLKQIDIKEKEQKWQSEGIASINDLIRAQSDNVSELCKQLASKIARHLNANQIAIYLLGKEGDDVFIELAASFAYDRYKHREQRINVGDGLLGQAILEKNYIYLTQVPADYVKITSGLGNATPRALIIFPLIYNEQVEGVIEIASFNKFEPFHIEFLKKATESIAASISSTKTAERTRHLLEETRSMSEQMRAQEEELRQNNEELQATQEEMARKLLEAEKKNELLAGTFAKRLDAGN